MRSIKGIGINADSQFINGNLVALESVLNVFKSVGFDYVELPVHGLDLIINGELNQQGLDQVKDILSKFPFKYSVHGIDSLNLMSRLEPEMHIKIFKATIDFAKEIKAELVVYHSSYVDFSDEAAIDYYEKKYGKLHPKEIYGLLLNRETDLMRELSDYCARSGITLGVENNFYHESEAFFSYGTRGNDLVDFIKSVDRENVRILYDFGHGHISAQINGFDYLEDVRTVSPYLGHIHLHDNYGKCPHYLQNSNIPDIFKLPFGIGDLHMPIGMGIIPYNEVFDIIKDYKGIYCFEIQPRYAIYYKNTLIGIKNILQL